MGGESTGETCNANSCKRGVRPECGNVSLRRTLIRIPGSDLRLLNQRTPQAIPLSFASLSAAERVWDGNSGRWIAQLYPNEHFATRDDVTITAHLSCCIAVCVSDPIARIGGMNHFTLPQLQCPARRNRTSSVAAWSGCQAMETLIDAVVRLGAAPERLQMKLAGAGQTLSGQFDTSVRNLDFVRGYLQGHGWHSEAEDVGGNRCRAVEFHVASGKVRVRSLTHSEAIGVARRDMAFLTDIQRSGRSRAVRHSAGSHPAG